MLRKGNLRFIIYLKLKIFVKFVLRKAFWKISVNEASTRKENMLVVRSESFHIYGMWGLLFVGFKIYIFLLILYENKFI